MKRRRLLVIPAAVLITVVLIAAIAVSSFAQEERSGISFKACDLYRTTEEVSAIPHTWEAWIKVEKNADSGRLGVIMGNYTAGVPSVSLEIRPNGQPGFWWCDGNTSVNTIFDKIDLRTGEWIFLTLTNTNSELKCYVNGELKQTKSVNLVEIPDSDMSVLCLGGDLRSGNVQYLKQTLLSSAAVYSTVRTQEEIQSDYAKINEQDTGILGYWDLSVQGSDRLTDLSENGKNLHYINTTDSSKNEPKDEEETVPEEGMTFGMEPSYRLIKALEKAPETYEATIWLSKNFNLTERPGIILGNYSGGTECINFEITTNGAPRLYLVTSDGKVYDWVFNNVNMCTGKWTHLAIVKDGKKLCCYVNGVLKQEKAIENVDVLPTMNLCVGGDLRSGNERAFAGRIKNITLYENARSAEQILADSKNPGSEKDGMILHYSMDQNYGGTMPEKVEDSSGNGYTLKKYSQWISEKEPVTDYAYSFAIVGDTQIMNAKHQEGFTGIYDYILENVESKKIKLVIGLGDITDGNSANEWSRAVEQIKRMDTVVPYTLVRGNHDSANMFNKSFGYQTYTETLEGFYKEGDYTSSWRTLQIGKIKYLILMLDYGASDSVLSWAGEVIESHADYNVIVTTHAYLFRDGTTLDQNDVCPPATNGGYNNGDHIWDKLIKKYENIVMVLCGHDPTSDIVLTKTQGEKGNTVSQLLIDPQGVDLSGDGGGLVAMFYFSEDGKTVQVEYYSTVKKQYLLESNQFTFTLDVVESEADLDDDTNPGTDTETDDPGTGDTDPGDTDTDDPDTGDTDPGDTDTDKKDNDSQEQETSGNSNNVLFILIIAAVSVAIAACIVVAVVIAVKKRSC